MSFGDRRGWDAKIEGREVGKKPSKPGPVETTDTSLDVYLDQIQPPLLKPQPLPEPPPEPVAPPEPVEVEVLPAGGPPAKPVRYHSVANKLAPGLHVLRIGGELTGEALKRVVDFITQELHAQQY